MFVRKTNFQITITISETAFLSIPKNPILYNSEVMYKYLKVLNFGVNILTKNCIVRKLYKSRIKAGILSKKDIKKYAHFTIE